MWLLLRMMRRPWSSAEDHAEMRAECGRELFFRNADAMAYLRWHRQCGMRVTHCFDVGEHVRREWGAPARRQIDMDDDELAGRGDETFTGMTHLLEIVNA